MILPWIAPPVKGKVIQSMRKEAGMKVDPLPDVSLEPKPKKVPVSKVIDIRQMLKDNAAHAAQQKVR